MGLVRNLTAGEILAQVFYAKRVVKKHGMVRHCELVAGGGCSLLGPKYVEVMLSCECRYGFVQVVVKLAQRTQLGSRLLPARTTLRISLVAE